MEGWRQLGSVCLVRTLITPSGEEVQHIGIGLKAKLCEDSGDTLGPQGRVSLQWSWV